MTTKNKENLNYIGSLIGFIGATFAAIALSTTDSSGVATMECIQSQDASCIKPYMIMNHPYLNIIGLNLIWVGFLIQFLPALEIFYGWIRSQKFNTGGPGGT